jgi:hypothetical protein
MRMQKSWLRKCKMSPSMVSHDAPVYSTLAYLNTVCFGEFGELPSGATAWNWTVPYE